MTPKLELRGVVVRRGDRDVLRVDSLSVAPGEMLAVIGPNGSGKSTLLQVAALLVKPAAGEVLLDGVAAGADTLALRRRLAIAMQEPHLIQGSVLDNAALGLALRGVPKRERQERALTWLRRFGVEALASRRANRISGGEAQRLSLARAFAVNPELLLLDEPFSALDEATRQQLLDDLAAVVAETGVTTIFVTHDRDEALRLADRVAVLIDGRLRQAGAATEVFGAPVDEDVAAFVGVETIVAGRVVSIEDGLATVAVGQQRLSAVAPPGIGANVRVCIRPEDVTLEAPTPGEGAPTSARNHLAGTVREVRPRGAEARLVIDCGPSTLRQSSGQAGSGQGFRLVATVTRRSVEEMGLAPGVRVLAAVKATAIHLLPGGSREEEAGV
jgi:tungstate transport system ATP-binding protein